VPEAALTYDFERIEQFISTQWVWVPDDQWDGKGEVDYSRPPPDEPK